MSSGTSGFEPSGGGGDGPGVPVALARWLDGEPAGWTDGEVSEALEGLAEVSGRVNAALARVAAAFDSRLLAASDGIRTTATWVAGRTELSRPAAAALVHTGRGLRACGVVDARARGGELGAAKVRALLDARVDLEDTFADHEPELVATVLALTVEHAQHYLRAWRRHALTIAERDDGPEPHKDAGRNQFHLSKTFGGRWVGDLDLDEDTGERLFNCLDARIDRQVKAGLIDPAGAGRPRSGWRADALVDLVLAGDTTDAPAGQPRAHVTLRWDADDLLGIELADLAELDRRACVTTGGSTLAYEAATLALCNADVIDVLVRFGFDRPDTILGVTSTRRHPTDHEREALDLRDQGCVFPGCDARIQWCHAHHTIPYEIGHRTRLDELVLLCPHHHQTIHKRGWTLTRNIDTGHITVTRPDGTTLTTPRRPARAPDAGEPNRRPDAA